MTNKPSQKFGNILFFARSAKFLFFKISWSNQCNFSRWKNKIFKDKQTQISRSKSKNLGTISRFCDVWNCRFLTFVCNFIFCPNQVIWKYCGKEKKGGSFKSLFLEYLPSFSNLKFPHSYAPNQTWRIFFFKSDLLPNPSKILPKFRVSKQVREFSNAFYLLWVATLKATFKKILL